MTSLIGVPPSDLEARIAGAAELRVIAPLSFSIDWDSALREWAHRVGSGGSLDVLCESDNYLFARSFLTDHAQALPRRTFQEMRFQRDQLLDTLGRLPDASRADTVTARLTHLPAPLAVVEGDDFIAAAVMSDDGEPLLEVLDETHPWFPRIRRYVEIYFDPDRGGKYAAAAGSELLELFDHGRIPRGIYPRHSFYDTDYSQLVIWALIFDRRGRLLIHRRSDNAKDNQGMWDKSVGGHVDFAEDVDPSRAVVREVVEELFTDETAPRQFHAFSVSDEDILFLGEWRPRERGNAIFTELRQYDEDWGFLRVRKSPHVYTPRTLANGVTRRLRVIADVFLFVAGPVLSDELLAELKNSQYKLVEISELKSAMDLSIAGKDVPGFEQSSNRPAFTPDLVNIMTGELRDTLDEFSQYIKRYLSE